MKLSDLSPERRRVMLAEAAGIAPMFHLMKRGLYYRRNGHGYTTCECEAWKLSEEESNKHVYPHDEPVTKHPVPLPDPYNSLEDCHDLEAKLTDEQHEQFRTWLGIVVYNDVPEVVAGFARISSKTRAYVSASADQRASALLLTFYPELEP